jgi:hypothetical protein
VCVCVCVCVCVFVCVVFVKFHKVNKNFRLYILYSIFSHGRYKYEDLNCNSSRVNYDIVGQSAFLRFVRRYMLVYRRILGRQSVSTAIFLVYFWNYKIIRFARMTFHFICQYCTPQDVKVTQSRHYTSCARCREKLTLSDIDRLFSGQIDPFFL